MTFHTHPDWQALLRTICTYPEADLPRLVAADWLEERAEMEPCEACGHDGGYFDSAGKWNFCERCNGTAFVSPMAEYAEFIRVGCEAERLDIHDPRYTPARAWEQELWMAGETWRQEMRRSSGAEIVLHQDVNEGPMPSGPYMVVAGGFGRVIHASLAWLIGGECECMAPRVIHEPSGMTFTPTSPLNDCPTCHGTGRTPGHLDELVRRQPVTRVVVTAMGARGRPAAPGYSGGNRHWLRVERGGFGDSHELPPVVFDAMPLPVVRGEVCDRKEAPDEQSALDALSLALLNPARERAGLPPLHPATLEVVR